MVKRSDGELEREVLGILWGADSEMTPGGVQAGLSGSLAYTTVATILTRLHAKGWVNRREHGRGFVYEAAVSESELASSRIASLLDAAYDRRAVLTGFVGRLSHKDIEALRSLLKRAP